MLNLPRKVTDLSPITLYWLAGMLGNFLNWMCNFILVRHLSLEGYGLITILLTFQFIISIPAIALQTTSNKFGLKPRNHLLYFTVILSIGWSILYLLTINLTSALFHIPPNTIQIPILLMITSFFPLAWYRGLINARQRYTYSGVIILLETITKLIIIIIGIPTNNMFVLGAISIPFSFIVPLFIGYLRDRTQFSLVRNLPSKSIIDFYLQSLLLGIGVIVPISIDILFVRAYLPINSADIYAILTLVGKTLFFIVYSVIGLLIPILATQTNYNQQTRYLYVIILISFGLCVLSLLIFTYLPQLSLQILLGDKYPLILPYLNTYILAITSLSLAATLATYHLMRENYLYPSLSILAVITQIIVFYNYHANLAQMIDNLFYIYTGLALAMGISHALKLDINYFKKILYGQN